MAFLRTIAVSRALRLHLPSTQYDRLLKSDGLCSKLKDNPREAAKTLLNEGGLSQDETDLLFALQRHPFLLRPPLDSFEPLFIVHPIARSRIDD